MKQLVIDIVALTMWLIKLFKLNSQIENNLWACKWTRLFIFPAKLSTGHGGRNGRAQASRLEDCVFEPWSSQTNDL